MMMLPKALTGSLIFSFLSAVALYFMWQSLNDAKEVIQGLTGWRDGMVTSIGLASGNPQVNPDTAQVQVQAMGFTISELKATIATSNQALDQLHKEHLKAVETAKIEAKRKEAAIRKAEELSEELRVSAQISISPDQMNTEVRRVQDLVYEAGL